MADFWDHRENNIILAKNLNQAKIDLREKKHDIAALETELQSKQQKLAQSYSNDALVMNKINIFKQQLDEAFIQNTKNYMHLSLQIEQIQKEVSKNSKINYANVPTSSIQLNPQAFHSIVQFASNETSSTAPLNDITNEIRETELNTTFSFESTGDESVFNTTFLCNENDENSNQAANITVRRKKKSYMREINSTTIRTSLEKMKNAMSIVSSRGRTVKKIDYTELSVGDQYKRSTKLRK